MEPFTFTEGIWLGAKCFTGGWLLLGPFWIFARLSRM